MFLSHGDRVISDYIRKCLDSGDTFDTAILLGETSQDINENEDDDSDNEKSKSSESVGANSMVDVLIAFLDCLPEPVIPTSFYSRALAAADSNELIKAVKKKKDKRIKKSHFFIFFKKKAYIRIFILMFMFIFNICF